MQWTSVSRTNAYDYDRRPHKYNSLSLPDLERKHSKNLKKLVAGRIKQNFPLFGPSPPSFAAQRDSFSF